MDANASHTVVSVADLALRSSFEHVRLQRIGQFFATLHKMTLDFN